MRVRGEDMRLKQQLTLIILITILTLTGPVQAVTASQLADHDDSNTTTKMRLPNEGRSDLQELIQRVDANVGEPSSEEPSSDPEVDEPETAEEPVEDSGVSEAEVKEAPEATDSQKPVAKNKAPKAITTNTNGDSTWTFDSDTGLLVFGAGTLAERIDNNLTNAGVTPADVTSIQFESGVVAPTAVTYLFANLTQLSELIDLNNFNTSSVTSMSYWFYQTTALSTPDLSTFVTSNVTSMSYMFRGSGVTSLDLSSWNVDKVTTFAYMFYATLELTTLNLSGWGDGRTATTVNMSYMFWSSTTSKLTNLNLSNFKTKNVTNMSLMFRCIGVTSLDINSWDVTKVNNFYGMFYGAANLLALNLSGWGGARTATGVDMSLMFQFTSSLTDLNLTNFKTTNVTNMYQMFYGVKLTNLDLSDWDVTKVTDFTYMFSSTSLTSLNVSGWGVGRTANNVKMAGMFNATSLTNLDMTNFQTKNVTNMSNMFSQVGLTSLDLSDWDVTKVTTFKSMFGGSKLKTLTLGEWNIGDVATTVDMSGMFATTTELTNLNITNTTAKNITTMASMFANSTVTAVVLDDNWNLDTVSSFSYMFDRAKCSTISFLNCWDLPTATNVNMTYMFTETSALNNLNLTNFKSTDATNMNYMFWKSGVTSLDFSEWDVSNVTGMAFMFGRAENLTSLNLSNWGVTRNVTNVAMSGMFAYTTTLTDLNLTNFKTTNVVRMNNMFEESGVTSLDIQDWDVTEVLSFRYMFYDADSLTTLDLTDWGVGRSASTVDMYAMFGSMSALTNLTLTNFKTTNVTNMSSMFSNTSGLTSLDLSDWDVTNVTNMSSMFSDTSRLTSLDLSDWDVTNVTNMNYMFYQATRLRTLDISNWSTSSPAVVSMFFNTFDLWKITLGPNVKFAAHPSFRSAPAAGTTIPGTSYTTTAASWQIVGTGTEFNPKGAMVTTTEMYADRTEPVTYVWANKAEASTPAIDTISSLTFGTLAASDFFNGNSPLATNMTTGSVALEDLDNITTYNVTVAQTSDWITDGESATIAKSNLKIKYGTSDLSTSASSFWSGTSATATKNIAFNHDTTKNFSIWLNPSTVLNTALLGKQLESELTWTLSETP